MNKNVKVILTGGFLGAGKTTLLWKASQYLMKREKKVGLITNDQAPELVDSTLLINNGLKVEEVSGSCYCCNFNGFINAVQHHSVDQDIDYIIAEPVGSCADLSATIVQPLKAYWRNRIKTAPLSVLADPDRLFSILNGGYAGLHTDAAYIFHKQLEESDIIVINKIDLLSAAQLSDLTEKTKQAYLASTVMAVSATTGEGVEAWLEEVVRRNDSGKRIVEVDYDVYAHGEAVLGWLNGTVVLTGEAIDWDSFMATFTNDMCVRFEKEALPVGHVKALLEHNNKTIVSNFTGKKETLTVRGAVGRGDRCTLIINARVETSPENLDAIVRETLVTHTATLTCTEVAWKRLQPGRPNPTYRFDKVVQ